LRVSAHFLVERDGSITQFVSCLQRAWHAGQSAFAGRDNCNDFSIGAELEGTDELPYTAAQYDSLVRLTRALRRAYPPITAHRISRHRPIAPGGTTATGPAFDSNSSLARLDAPPAQGED